MKIHALLLLMLLLFGVFASKVKAQDLELTTNLISKSYCAANPDMFMIRMKMLLRYTNVGKQVLIVPKGNLITYWRTGRNTDELLANSWVHVFWMFSGNGDMTHLGSKPDSRFCVLKPGASCEIESSDVNIVNTERLDAGKYLLQVSVPVWNGTNEQAYSLRDKWKRFGFVWLDALKSKPMPFAVEEKPKMVDCS